MENCVGLVANADWVTINVRCLFVGLNPHRQNWLVDLWCGTFDTPSYPPIVGNRFMISSPCEFNGSFFEPLLENKEKQLANVKAMVVVFVR